MDRPITDEMLATHIDNFKYIEKQVIGLAAANEALKIRAGILERDGQVESAQSLRISICCISDAMKNIIAGTDKIVKSENVMFECINKRLENLKG